MSFLRLIRNVILLAAYGVAGAALRCWRRLRRSRPRIWHGMFSSILTPPHVQADRAAGFPSRSVVTKVVGNFELNRNEDYTVVLDAQGVKNHDLLWAGL